MIMIDWTFFPSIWTLIIIRWIKLLNDSTSECYKVRFLCDGGMGHWWLNKCTLQKVTVSKSQRVHPNRLSTKIFGWECHSQQQFNLRGHELMLFINHHLTRYICIDTCVLILLLYQNEDGTIFSSLSILQFPP